MKARLLAIGAAVVAFAGCTTSRAVLAWHDGWRLEAAGEPGLAAVRYDEAVRRNSRLYGAALNRVRLLAVQPDRRKEADETLDKVLKSAGAEPEVAAFGARFALCAGDARLARARLDAARPLRPEDAGEARSALVGARIAVLAANGHTQQAAAELPATATAAALPPLWAATLRWNAGLGNDVAPPASAGSGGALLAAVTARDGRAWEQELAALAGLEGDDVTPLVLGLRAEAALHLDRPTEARTWAHAAAQRAPGDAWLQELQALALLQQGEVGQARDLLTGLAAGSADWSVPHHLGIARFRSGDLAGAAQAFATATRRCPTCAAPRTNLAVLARAGIAP